MIVGQHSVIRTADIDDADALYRLYDLSRPRAALLDKRRESLLVSRDDLREMLHSGERKKRGGEDETFYAVEDASGIVRGFCSLRPARDERNYAQFVILFHEDESYRGAMAGEVFEYLHTRAFQHYKLNKVSTHCLDVETAHRDFLLGRGFESDGVQREMYYGQGRWHDLESLTLFAGRAGEN